jgi:hypothetical protein
MDPRQAFPNEAGLVNHGCNQNAGSSPRVRLRNKVNSEYCKSREVRAPSNSRMSLFITLSLSI